MTQRVRISMNNLPPRARQLNPAEMQTVFGGCLYRDWRCDATAKDPGCCPGLRCVVPGGSMTSSTMSVTGGYQSNPQAFCV